MYTEVRISGWQGNVKLQHTMGYGWILVIGNYEIPVKSEQAGLDCIAGITNHIACAMRK